MRRFMLSVCACLLAVLWVGLAANPAPVSANPPGPVNKMDSSAPLDGFSVDAGRAERAWESKFRALPDPAILRSTMQRISAHPHHVGTEYDRANAERILSLFREWGWDAHIENFEVLFPTPRERRVELVEPTHFLAKLEEPTVSGDPTSDQHAEQLPTYNAYSIDGDVTAPLIYVNYGMPEDYEQLDRLGISVKGAIVIARYGQSWRGIKPKVAAEHGAVGCIIYSDPRDDGYFQGDVFPGGPWRPSEGVQRGSVMDMVLYPGDPLTPGVGATKDAQRLPLAEAPTLTKIPVLPISYGDAQPLLSALRGPVAPEAWRGSLPLTYHVGPGPARVNLQVKSNWDTQTIHDVIARIPGADSPDEWILRGNHEDAWVNGGEDPVSGLVDELEEARSLGELLKQGWKPRRTIIYCVWDGEEPGLLGSTEWGEEHAEELRRHAAVYINSDSNGPRLPRCRRLAHAGKVREWRGARHRGPGNPPLRMETPANFNSSPTGRAKSGRKPAPVPTGAWTPWVQAPTTRFFSIIWASLRSTSALAVKLAAVFTTPSMMISTGIHILVIPISVMAGRWPRPPAPPCCAWRTPTCSPSISPPSRIRFTSTPSR